MTDTQAKKALLHSLLLLTFLFIFAQLCFFIVTDMGYISMMFKKNETAYYFNDLFSTLGLHFTAHLIINVIFFLSIGYQTISIAELLQWRGAKLPILGRCLWVLNTFVLLLANCYFFPNSNFSKLVFITWLNQAFLVYILVMSGSLLALAVSLTLLNLFSSLLRKKNLVLHGSALAFLVWVALIYAVDYYEATPVPMAYATADKPNVIVIGLDALRPDVVANNKRYGVKTPTINNFLQSSVVFADTRTPLARTFPAWVSILTGRYPKNTNARANLVAYKNIKPHQSLAKIFSGRGYETIYASDDTMFSPVTQNFDFEVIAGPARGVGTYVGLINDFPLSNFVSISPFGRYLFPYNYACHTNTQTYFPANFLHLINVALHHRSAKPAFIAVHLNRAAWPYLAARQKTTSTKPPSMYAASVTALDSQLKSFLISLQANHLLDHAVVVLLSDHGTGLGLPGDRITNPDLLQGDKTAIKLSKEVFSVPTQDAQGKFIERGVNTDYGYGSDVLGIAYNSLLAFKTYGTLPLEPPHIVHGRVSLVDIAPSLLDLLAMQPLTLHDGMSLKPYLLATGKDISPAREVYLESSDTMPEIEGMHVSQLEVIKKAANNYSINKDGEVVLKDKSIKELVNLDQKAIVQGDWLLADMPATVRYHVNYEKNIYQPYISPPLAILVNLKTGLWTADLHSSFAQTAPVAQLTRKLTAFYGDELSAF